MKWEQPPTPTKAPARQIKYLDIADQLRARPGEWALIVEDGWASMSNQIMSGGLAAFRPRGAFEARTVFREGGARTRGAVYARYTGEPEPAAQITPDAEKEPVSGVAALSESDIRADERERVAKHLESLRFETWNGGERKVNNASFFAGIIRRLP